MEELFQQLLEAEILTEDVKTQLEDVFNQSLTEAIEGAKKAAEEEVRTELTEKWVTERDALIEAVDTQVGEFLNEELSELKEDINRFRDLEAEYAEKLVEAKSEMAANLESDLAELVEKIDAFLEIRLNSELEELKEDIEEVKKLEFGRKIFEGIVAEYRANYVDEDGVEAELAEARRQAADATAALEEAEAKLDKQIREAKMAELLEPLTGKQHDIMETILEKLPTEQLEEGYKTFIGRVIKDSVEQVDEAEEKETPVLAEAEETKDEDKKVDLKGMKIVDGNTEETITESVDGSKISEEDKLALKRLAGIIS